MDLYALLLLCSLTHHTEEEGTQNTMTFKKKKENKGAFVSFYSVKLQFPGSFKEAK
jgi:hypothetical protein